MPPTWHETDVLQHPTPTALLQKELQLQTFVDTMQKGPQKACDLWRLHKRIH